MDGWTGKVLRVDLGMGTTRFEELGGDRLREVIGGRGYAVRVLAEEVDPATDALAPENKLVLAAGVLTGTGAVCGSALTAASKSPATGGLCAAQVKGHFGAELKQAGIDAIIIEGKSKFPAYLQIVDGRVKIQPALQLWGRSTERAAAIIRSEMRDTWKARELMVLSIGPAGEKMARHAALVNEGYLVQGGPGLGAVMGSKNLKAIAVLGHEGVSVARGSAFVDTVSSLITRLCEGEATGKLLPELGSPVLLDALGAAGGLAVRNHLAPMQATPLTAHGLAAFHRFSRSCFGCPIGCRQFGEIPSGARGKAPELDAAAALGPKCGISDPAAVFAANLICTGHGLDPVAAGGTIACAMELASLGLMEGGPIFGDADSMLKALDAMAKGSAQLAGGAAALSVELGRPECFMGIASKQTGGSEIPAIEVRAVPSVGLHFATTGIAPHELSAFGLVKRIFGKVYDPGSSRKMDIAEKAALCLASQEEAALMDSLGLCVLPLLGVGLDDLLPLLPAATGWDASKEELLASSRKTLEIERGFSSKAGVLIDSLPARLTSEPLESGPAVGRVCSLDALLPEYKGLISGGTDTKRAAA